MSTNDPRGQAHEFHSFVLGLVAENERLRQQVAGLEQTVAMLSQFQPPMDSETAKAWGRRLEQAPGWRSLTCGTISSWDESGGYPLGGGLLALLADLTAIPGDDRGKRLAWDINERERARRNPPGTYRMRPYPPRFRGLYDATWILHERGDVGLSDLLRDLTKGLRSGSKLLFVIKAAFLLYGTDAVRMLSTEPDELVSRLIEEVNRASEPEENEMWKRFRGLFSGTAPSVTKEQARSVLGVAADATADDVKAAYRRLVREHHPDAGGDVKEFHKVAEAYEVLAAVSPVA